MLGTSHRLSRVAMPRGHMGWHCQARLHDWQGQRVWVEAPGSGSWIRLHCEPLSARCRTSPCSACHGHIHLSPSRGLLQSAELSLYCRSCGSLGSCLQTWRKSSVMQPGRWLTSARPCERAGALPPATPTLLTQLCLQVPLSLMLLMAVNPLTGLGVSGDGCWACSAAHVDTRTSL